MHCEICETIAKLGLDPHAHASYECATGENKTATYFSDLKERVQRGELPNMVVKLRNQSIIVFRKGSPAAQFKGFRKAV